MQLSDVDIPTYPHGSLTRGPQRVGGGMELRNHARHAQNQAQVKSHLGGDARELQPAQFGERLLALELRHRLEPQLGHRKGGDGWSVLWWL